MTRPRNARGRVTPLRRKDDYVPPHIADEGEFYYEREHAVLRFRINYGQLDVTA